LPGAVGWAGVLCRSGGGLGDRGVWYAVGGAAPGGG